MTDFCTSYVYANNNMPFPSTPLYLIYILFVMLPMKAVISLIDKKGSSRK